MSRGLSTTARAGGVLALSLVTALVLASAAHAGRTKLMYRMEPRAHGAREGVTQAQIRKVVVDLLERGGWVTHTRTAGVVEADISVRRGKHRATIVVVFDDQNFAVRYLDSYNLGYTDSDCRAPRHSREDEPRYMKTARERLSVPHSERCVSEAIHPDYNHWVRKLEGDIVSAVPRLRPAASQTPVPTASATVVAEGVRKLEALHEAGVLTAAELEAHKRLLPGSGLVGAGSQSVTTESDE